jgi:hypothetical protein
MHGYPATRCAKLDLNKPPEIYMRVCTRTVLCMVATKGVGQGMPSASLAGGRLIF